MSDTPHRSLLPSRKQWSLACQFHDWNVNQVFNEISDRVSKEIQVGGRPIVIFDLDSTLYEVGPRTFKIIQDWTESPRGSMVPEFRDWVRSLKEDHVRYSVAETLEEAFLRHKQVPAWGENRREWIESIQRFWFERFFTDEYLIFDRAYPRAMEFVSQVYRSGAEVVYLTGRHEGNMGRGTILNLVRDGFPWGFDRIHLLMKPRFEIPDLEFKLGASLEFCRSGRLIASFENEPPNIAALYRQFPEAMHVFVDTVCGAAGADPCVGLYRIDHW
jgi:hypothetical protein